MDIIKADSIPFEEPYNPQKKSRILLNPAAEYCLSLSPKTQRTITISLKRITKILGDGDTDVFTFPWWELSTSQVHAVRMILQKQYHPTTANLSLQCLRQVFKSCWRQSRITSEQKDKLRDIPPIPGQKKPAGRLIKREELKRLLQVLTKDDSNKGARDLAMFFGVFLDVGLRRSEVANLLYKDIDLEEASLFVHHGKGGKNRTCFLSEPAIKMLEQWIEVRGSHPGPLFCRFFRHDRMHEGSGLSDEGIAQIFKSRLREAGIKGKVTLHSTRRTFATNALEQGVDLLTVAQMLGHSSLNTVQVYNARGDKAKKKAAKLRWYYEDE